MTRINDHELNDCQRAIAILGTRPDAEDATLAGLFIRRKIAAPGELSDGTRTYVITPCPRRRWIVIQLGWDTIAEIDQRTYFQQPERLAADVIAAIDRHAEQAARNAAFRSELTPAGEQLVIPGCERNFAPGKRQLDLFG